MKAIGAVLILALLAFGCGRKVQSKEAVKEGVLDYLSGRAGLNIDSMDVEVTSVTFRGEEADATVTFQAKGSTAPGSGMQMQYTLKREGNRWVVQGKTGAGGASPHGAGMQMNPHGSAMPSNPHGMMPPSGGGKLPAGHPPMKAPEKAAPAGRTE